MIPRELLYKGKEHRVYIEGLSGGANCSLIRNEDIDCVVAYKEIDCVLYITIKTSKDYISYVVAKLPNRYYGNVIDNKMMIEKKPKVVDKEEYSKFIKKVVVGEL